MVVLSEKLVEYEHDGVVLEGLLVTPGEAAGLRPGVLIAHAWGGRGEIEENCARRLAELGYAGFAIDMFGKGIRGTSRDENAALIAPFLNDRAKLQARIISAFSALQNQPQVESKKIAALGYCFGGLCVLDLARSGTPARGVVSVHGLFTPPADMPPQPIRAKVLALHGHQDPMVPVEAVNQLEAELTAAGADWQIHVYGGAMHAFTNPAANDPDFGTVYNAEADRRAWAAATFFLAEVLG
jgi:dienelactone hydrolase